MHTIDSIANLNNRLFDFLRIYFSKVPVRYSLAIRNHPEEGQLSTFFSYRDINHYFNFKLIEDSVFFLFRVRTIEGMVNEFREKQEAAINQLTQERRDLYKLAFGNSTFSEKRIFLSEKTRGVETISTTPFLVNATDYDFEKKVFPFIFPAFLHPSNEIAFRRKKFI